MKEEYVNELRAKIDKVAKEDIDKEIAEMIVSDIKRYINEEDQHYVMTQHVIGMELLFKGWVVRNWLNVQDDQQMEMKQMNKIIVKISMMFYSKAWQHCNEVLHDKDKYREHVIEWHRRLNKEIERG